MKHNILLISLLSLSLQSLLLASSKEFTASSSPEQLTISKQAVAEQFEEDYGADESQKIAEIVPEAVETTLPKDETYLATLWYGLNQANAGIRYLKRWSSTDRAQEQLTEESNRELQERIIENFGKGIVDIDALLRETKRRHLAELAALEKMFFNKKEFNLHEIPQKEVLEILDTWENDFSPFIATAGGLYLKRYDIDLSTTKEKVRLLGTSLTNKPANYL
jgi:hypothetical protein